MQPLTIELPHRLGRHFGSDRFIELTIPQIMSRNLPDYVKARGEAGAEALLDWLLKGFHHFLGRKGAPIFVRPVKVTKAVTGSDGIISMKKETQDRLCLFAETADSFRSFGYFPPTDVDVDRHTTVTRRCLLNWLLQFSNNTDQPYLKLFSQIALGLSRTRPTVTLEPHQILCLDQDILSPTNSVMNDGMGRMSPNLMHNICTKLGLCDRPAGFQGRIGSAKGFWLCDWNDTSNEVWIELFPSQRKWRCDFLDEDHRTFEVCSVPRELKSARLNTQFITLLEHNAVNKEAMRICLGELLKNDLQDQCKELEAAIEDPVQLRAWIWKHAPSSREAERFDFSKIPFSGSFPKHREDKINYLLYGGFHPKELKYLGDLVKPLLDDKCNELKEQQHITVPQSTTTFMAADISKKLKPNEVHFACSFNFHCTMPSHGMEVLVARSAAHYVSDIQKVKLVYIAELSASKDVIFYPCTGNNPLADKLSGGDYDGDIAWICWD
ncbi:RNA-dependent RNA polymerase [Xylariales sp. PMI_506]|nr:RNA-dependent RNA polymerase [Xylariales sp. PMI_506]